MSDSEPVILEGIPVFTGDLALLDTKVSALAEDGAKVATAAGDIHSSFGGLQAFYKAPEADQLFATTKPVADRGAALKSDLATITGALGTYSDDAYPLVEKLRQLKRDAGAFLVKANADDEWREDGDLVEENNRRRDEIAETWAAFQAVERACYNKIISLVPHGTPLTTGDGSGGKGMYGYDAEALKQAKGLPWGDPVKESTPWYHVHEHTWDFVKGFAVDGVWATVKGLGTLVGFDGWDAAKQAWTGLGNLTTGVILTIAAPHVLWLTPEDKLPGFARDARKAMTETGKALIAYDQWGENPARAGGAVTFNVLTTVFTGGAGAGVSGAGKAAVAAKALSFANKAGRFVDPTTYLFKGAGAGLTKISDVMAGLRGTGSVEIPTLPPGAITLPDGGFKLADGTLHLPEGAAIPDGAFEIPRNSVKLPAGAEIPAGAVDLGDGVVHLPEGVAPPAGSLPIQEGALKLPEGTTALPEGTYKDFDAEGNVIHLDRQGNILGEDGTLKQHHTAAQRENPTDGASVRTDADSPLPRTPAEQSALVGAGTRGGSDPVRLGSGLGDPGRIGDDLVRTGNDAANLDRTPGGTANNLPTNSVDNGAPGGGSRGGQGGDLPANNPDGGGPTGTDGRDVHNGSASEGTTAGSRAHSEGPGSADSGYRERAEPQSEKPPSNERVTEHPGDRASDTSGRTDTTPSERANEPIPELTTAERAGHWGHLDEVEGRAPDEFDHLRHDPDHRGKITDDSMDEARVGLDLREQGRLPADIRRPNEADMGEFYSETTGRYYDIKGVHSFWPPFNNVRNPKLRAGPFPGAYNPARDTQTWVNTFTSMILEKNRIVIIDVRNANQAAINSMKEIVDTHGWGDHVIWYP
ncbi:hypothetical protein [Streptomyces anulatus]|uniref:hypothetical protein n=1 Tax=Streptomyces anulatus TaxID=1892 RepID=UPI0033CCB612